MVRRFCSSPSSMQKLPNIKEKRKKVKKKKTGKGEKNKCFRPVVIGVPQVRLKGNRPNEKRNVSALARSVVLIS